VKLKNVVPWGRSFEEYKEIFSLTEKDLLKTILGCGDGPASFNADLSFKGGKVVSVDPTYCFNTEQLKSRIAEVYDEVMPQMQINKDKYLWESISSVEELGKISEQIGLEEHVKSLTELCRVANEVRIYPLLALNGEISPYLKDVMSELTRIGNLVSLVDVNYQFQKGANQMLVIKSV